MRVISLILFLCISLSAQDVLKTRKGGGVTATDYQLAEPFGEIGSKHLPAWKIHADSGLIKAIDGIYATLDSIVTTVSRTDTAIFTYSTPTRPAAALNIIPVSPQTFSHIGSPGMGIAYANLERLVSRSSHHLNADLTLNAMDYPDLAALGKAITDSGDSLVYAYIPAGVWEMPAAPIMIYGNKEVYLEFAPNAYIVPKSNWPSVAFNITTDADIPEGATSGSFSVADGDFSKIKVGMAFMARTQGSGVGSVTTSVWNEDHYIIQTINTSTGDFTFWPPFDGDPQSGNIGFTQSFGYDVNPYEPKPIDVADTLYSGGEVEFGHSSLIFAARGARITIDGGTWSANVWGGTTKKPVGSGGRGVINSVSSNGVIVKNATVVDSPSNGIILQNSDAYIAFDNNLVLFSGRAAFHIGGRGINTMLRNNTTYKCAAGLFSSLDLEKVFLLGNMFVKNTSTEQQVYANYGSLTGLMGDHQTIVMGNLFDGGLGALDVGHQSGRLTFAYNIIVNMISDGISVAAGTDPVYDVPLTAFMVDVLNNQISFSGRNGIYINKLEGGRVKGNWIYNNGTNTGLADSLRCGIRIDADSVQSVIVSENFAFNLPDSGSLSDYLYNMAETVAKTQQYGLFVSGTDETNLYRDNTAWENQTADFSVTQGLPSGTEFRYNSIPWQAGTIRFRSSDNTVHVWTGSAWSQL